jgi:hypothetical protein
MAVPRNRSSAKSAKHKLEKKIDESVAESFPASDPPSYMGGETLGAPKGRRTRHRPAMSKKKPAKKIKKKR